MEIPARHKGIAYDGPDEYGTDFVTMSEWATTRGTLRTRHAASCVILAAINKQTRTGLLGHFCYGDLRDIDFIEEAIEAIAHLGPADSTDIRLAGGREFENAPVVSCREEVRQRVISMAEEHGIPIAAIGITWLGDNQFVDAEIDCQAKNISIEEFSK
jgi:hypothetical protein